MVGDPHGDRADSNGGLVRLYYEAHEETEHITPSYMYAVCLFCHFAPTGFKPFCERSEESFKCKPTFAGWVDPNLADKPDGGKWVIDDWPVESFEAVCFFSQVAHHGVRLRGAAPTKGDQTPPLDVVFWLTANGLRTSTGYQHSMWGRNPLLNPENGHSAFNPHNTSPKFQHPSGRHYTVRELVGGHNGKNGLIAAGRYVLRRGSSLDSSTDSNTVANNTCISYAYRFLCTFAHELDSFRQRCINHPNEVEEVEEGNG